MLGDIIASFLMLIIGSAIIIIWFADINNNPEVDLTKGFFRAREKSSNNLFCFHLLAEFITGILLIIGASVILLNENELMFLVYFASGSLFYTSLNSLSWAFAFKRRYSYAYPMIAALILSVLIPVILNL